MVEEQEMERRTEGVAALVYGCASRAPLEDAWAEAFFFAFSWRSAAIMASTSEIGGKPGGVNPFPGHCLVVLPGAGVELGELPRERALHADGKLPLFSVDCWPPSAKTSGGGRAA